ncbi:conserved membrane hypothetical protein [Tenacibaculum sp. 190524A05c]
MDFGVREIGKFQFYSGISVGLGYAITLNYLLRLTLRTCNLGMDINNWSLNYEISSYYYLLIGFSSVCFAFCFTTNLWLGKLFLKNSKRTLKHRKARVNSVWILFGTLMFLLRLFWFLLSVDITIENDFPLLGFMIPLFIYLYCWNLISGVFKSTKALLISILVIMLFSVILSFL